MRPSQIRTLHRPADITVVLLVMDGLGGLPTTESQLTELEAARLRNHSWHPVPALLWGRTCRPDPVQQFGESSCLAGGLGPRLPATDLIPLAFAHGGRLKPDVVLMDVSMPNMNGIEATRIISNRWPDTRIIGLSMHEREDMAVSILDAGAEAYVSKADGSDQLLTAIRADALRVSPT
jgi:CheY-like chemotaxis protein